jgi:hypothetical protein
LILNASTFGIEHKGILKDKEKQPFREGKICQASAWKRHKKTEMPAVIAQAFPQQFPI